jgi:hypothetical protein
MNTSSDWSLVADNEAYQCRNILLDVVIGGMKLRNGFHAVTDSLANYTRIWSLHTHKFIDRQGFLFQVVERDTVTQLCDLFVSAPFGLDITDSLGSYLYPTGGGWLSWLDAQYYFNGKNRSKVVAGGPEDFTLYDMVPLAPGQPDAFPIAESGNLEGEYIYGIITEIPCSTDVMASRPGTLSEPIVAKGEKIGIRNFYPITPDSTCSNPGATIWFWIVRTKANRVDFDDDSLWIVDSILRPNTETDSILYVDNVADGSLGPLWGEMHDLRGDGSGDNRWAYYYWSYYARHNQAHAPGSMTFLAGDTIISSPGHYVLGTDTAFGEYDHEFNLYTWTLLNEKTGAQSDTAAVLVLYQPGAPANDSTYENITLGIPAAPSEDFARIIYRAHYIAGYSPDEFEDQNNKYRRWQLQTFYPLDTIRAENWDTTIFVDTTPPATLETNRSGYERKIPPGIFKGAIIHESRMFAWNDYRLYVSDADTAAAFPYFNNVEFDLDDGDRIISCASFEGYVVVYKTNSIWLLYTSDGTVYDRVKASFGVGMVSARSFSRYHGDNIYLGLDGINFESDSRYRSQKADRTFLSDPIRNILLRDPENMIDAAGLVVGDRYWLSYPGSDSCWTFFFKTGAWGLSDFDFYQGILYDTLDRDEYTTYRDFLFIKDDDERIFHFSETDSTDDGASFVGVWEKRHVARNPWEQQTISSMVLQQTSNVPATDSVLVYLTDENGDSLAVVTIDSLDQIYRKKRILSADNGTFHHLNLKIEALNRPDMVINALDLDIRPAGLD